MRGSARARPSSSPAVIVDKEFGRSRRLRGAINVGARIRPAQSWTDDATRGAAHADQRDPQGRHRAALRRRPVLRRGAAALRPRRRGLRRARHRAADDSAPSRSRRRAASSSTWRATRSSRSAAARGLHAAATAYGTPTCASFVGFIFEPSIGDRDGDGIKDDVDKCPDEPEDFDGFEDEDGCPDPDNDRDGILDERRQVPERARGPRTASRTRTAAPTAIDATATATASSTTSTSARTSPRTRTASRTRTAAPIRTTTRTASSTSTTCARTTPRTRTASRTRTAAPIPTTTRTASSTRTTSARTSPRPTTASRTRTAARTRAASSCDKGKIVILDKIYFETDKAIIKPSSFPILDAVAATLKGNPQILLDRDPGPRRRARRRRLQPASSPTTAPHSVLDVPRPSKGVEAERLQAQGLRRDAARSTSSHNEEALGEEPPRRVRHPQAERRGQGVGGGEEPARRVRDPQAERRGREVVAERRTGRSACEASVPDLRSRIWPGMLGHRPLSLAQKNGGDA